LVTYVVKLYHNMNKSASVTLDWRIHDDL